MFFITSSSVLATPNIVAATLLRNIDLKQVSATLVEIVREDNTIEMGRYASNMLLMS